MADNKNFRLITDSACDLSDETLNALRIDVVPFYIAFDNENYLKEGSEMTSELLYKKMEEMPDVFPKTSLPSVSDYMAVFEPCAAAGEDVICICLSSELSGSYNSARNAAQIVEESYPDAKITVLDSHFATIAQGLLVTEAARMRNAGLDYSKCVKKLRSLIMTGRIYFSIGTMDYLVHGGRVGRLKGAVASTLGLKPILKFGRGELAAKGVSRSTKKAMVKMAELTKSYFEQSGEDMSQYHIVVGYGSERKLCDTFKEMLVKKGISVHQTLPVCRIGAAISVHVGPQTVGLGFLKKYEYV